MVREKNTWHFQSPINVSKDQNSCATSRKDNILGCMADCLKLVEPRSKGECRPNLTYGNNYEFFVSFDAISGWTQIKFFLQDKSCSGCMQLDAKSTYVNHIFLGLLFEYFSVLNIQAANVNRMHHACNTKQANKFMPKLSLCHFNTIS
jgi:hypothetical protein